MNDVASMGYRFDVAVTFAGEDREYVAEIVDRVKGDLRVFYDEDFEIEAWGRDGIEYFSDVYQHQARYVVMFISHHYADKMWTRTERRAALARAATQRSEYVLPVRLDDTQLDGLLPTTIYLDARRYGTEGLIDAIRRKISGSDGSPTEHASAVVDGKVPRSQWAIQSLMTERAGPWEYLLYAGLLVANMEKLEPKHRDFAMGYARRTGRHIPTDSLVSSIQSAMASIQGIVDNFNMVLDPAVQELAFGKPGEPGDVDRIQHIAERFVSVYEDFMDWAAELRGTSADGNGADVLKALSRWAEQPVAECRRFVGALVAELDASSERRARGEAVHITMAVTLELDPDLAAEVEARLRDALGVE